MIFEMNDRVHHDINPAVWPRSLQVMCLLSDYEVIDFLTVRENTYENTGRYLVHPEDFGLAVGKKHLMLFKRGWNVWLINYRILVDTNLHSKF